MRRENCWALVVLLVLAGTALSSPLFPTADREREPICFIWQMYCPNPTAFDERWKQVPSNRLFTKPEEVKVGAGEFIAYRSARSGRRILAKGPTEKTWAFLVQTQEPLRGGDILFLLHLPTSFTDEVLGQTLENLPMIKPEGYMAAEYPLSKDGSANHKVEKELSALVFRLLAPYFNPEEISMASRPSGKQAAPSQSPASTSPASPSNWEAPKEGDEVFKIPPTGGLLLAHRYAANKLAFEAAWRQRTQLVQGGHPGSHSWSPTSLFAPRVAYSAQNEHHQAVCLPFDDTHYFLVIHFKDSERPDLGFYLRTPFEAPSPESSNIENLTECLPRFLPAGKQRPDHPLGRDGNLDAKVFMRDFFSSLLPLY